MKIFDFFDFAILKSFIQPAKLNAAALFHSLGITEADIYLDIGSGSHAEQVGNTMIDTLEANGNAASALKINKIIQATF